MFAAAVVKSTGRKVSETTKAVAGLVLSIAVLTLLFAGIEALAIALGLTPLAGYALLAFILWMWVRK